MAKPKMLWLRKALYNISVWTHEKRRAVDAFNRAHYEPIDEGEIWDSLLPSDYLPVEEIASITGFSQARVVAVLGRMEMGDEPSVKGVVSMDKKTTLWRKNED